MRLLYYSFELARIFFSKKVSFSSSIKIFRKNIFMCCDNISCAKINNLFELIK